MTYNEEQNDSSTCNPRHGWDENSFSHTQFEA